MRDGGMTDYNIAFAIWMIRAATLQEVRFKIEFGLNDFLPKLDDSHSCEYLLELFDRDEK